MQAVAAHFAGVALHQPGRKRALRHRCEVLVIAEVRVGQGFLQRRLLVGDEHCQLGTRQGLAAGTALDDFLVRRQELESAVKAARLLVAPYQAPVLAVAPPGLPFDQADGLGLAVVVVQHQIGDALRHFKQQGVAVLACQVAAVDHRVEQDLDVHLVVGAVDAAGIVDKVGIAAATGEAVLDPRQLRDSEVTALAYHLAAQLIGIHAQGVIGLVAHVRV